MARAPKKADRPAGSKRPIEQYDHKGQKRKNNPPVGLVTEATDRDAPKKQYAYDPHLDPTLAWAGKAEHPSFQVPTVSLHVHERIDPKTIIEAVRRLDNLTSTGWSESLSNPVVFEGEEFVLPPNLHWKTTPSGLKTLVEQRRVAKSGKALRYVRYFDDFPVSPLSEVWPDTGTGSFTEPEVYVVRRTTKCCNAAS